MFTIDEARTAVARFLDREDGAISIEAAIMLPLLGIAYVAGFSYFDTYRREAAITKATYTVADIVSREENTITPEYLEGMQELYAFLTHSEGRTWLRFTEIKREGDDLVIPADGLSYATDGRPKMTPARLDEIRDRIPRMTDGQYIVLTETFTTHEPVFDVGLKAREFPRIAPTRTRGRETLDWSEEPLPVVAAPAPFDVTSLPAPSIELFDTLAVALDPNRPPGWDKGGEGDNGWGNGDQDAAGKSGDKNNAENSDKVHGVHGAGSGSTDSSTTKTNNGGGGGKDAGSGSTSTDGGTGTTSTTGSTGSGTTETAPSTGTGDAGSGEGDGATESQAEATPPPPIVFDPDSYVEDTGSGGSGGSDGGYGSNEG